ncbi:mannose-6-phosphate isomerase [Lyngbya sp. PCC 8106]|nr:mannose-6-phosphate isomerase [Lyngbya sp. PCC 8106]
MPRRVHLLQSFYQQTILQGQIIMVAIQEKPQTATQLKTSSQGIASTELRPWGSFTTLEEGQGYKIKRIEVNPGHRLSLQMHHHRSEHWIVVSGTAKVTCGDHEEVLFANQSTYVPQCTSHRLENPGVIPLILIEVQNGEYLGEDDIVRFQDDYSRAPAQAK